MPEVQGNPGDLGTKTITFKADWSAFVKAAQDAFNRVRGFGASLISKLSVVITHAKAIGAAFLLGFKQAEAAGAGFLKRISSGLQAAFGRFGQTPLGKFLASIPPLIGKVFERLRAAGAHVIKHFGEMVEAMDKLEIGLFALAGPFGKLILHLHEVSAASAAAAAALGAFGGPGMTPVALGLAGVSIAANAVVVGLTRIVQAAGAVVEAIGFRLIDASRRWSEATMDLQRAEFALQAALRGFARTAHNEAAPSFEELSATIRKTASTTGVAVGEMAQGAAVLLEMSRVTQLTARQAQTLLEPLAGLAAFLNVPFMDAVLAVDNAFRGFTIRAQGLGLRLDEDQVITEATAKGFLKVGESVDRARLAQLRYQVLLDQLAPVAKAASEAVRTLYGVAIQRLRSELELLRAEMGRGVLAGWARLINVMSDAIATFRDLTKGVLPVVGAMVDLGGTLIIVIGRLAKLAATIVTVVSVWRLLNTLIKIFNVPELLISLTKLVFGFETTKKAVAAFGREAKVVEEGIAAFLSRFTSLREIVRFVGEQLLRFTRLSLKAFLTSMIHLVKEAGKFTEETLKWTRTKGLELLVKSVAALRKEFFTLVDVTPQVFAQLTLLGKAGITLTAITRGLRNTLSTLLGVLTPFRVGVVLAIAGLVQFEKETGFLGSSLRGLLDAFKNLLRSIGALGEATGAVKLLRGAFKLLEEAVDATALGFAGLAYSITLVIYGIAKLEKLVSGGTFGQGLENWAERVGERLEQFFQNLDKKYRPAAEAAQESLTKKIQETVVTQKELDDLLNSGRVTFKRLTDDAITYLQNQQKIAEALGDEERKRHAEAILFVQELLQAGATQKQAEEALARFLKQQQVERLRRELELAEAQGDLVKQRVLQEKLAIMEITAARRVSEEDTRKIAVEVARKRIADQREVEANVLESEREILKARALTWQEERRRIEAATDETREGLEIRKRAYQAFLRETVRMEAEARLETTSFLEQAAQRELQIRKAAAAAAAGLAGDELAAVREQIASELAQTEQEMRERGRQLALFQLQQQTRLTHEQADQLLKLMESEAAKQREILRIRFAEQVQDVVRRRRDEILSLTREAATAEADLMDTTLTSENRIYEAVRFNTKRRLAELKVETRDRLRQIEESGLSAEQKERRITAVLQIEAAKRKAIIKEEQEARKQVIAEGAEAEQRLGLPPGTGEAFVRLKQLQDDLRRTAQGLQAQMEEGFITETEARKQMMEAQKRYNEEVNALADEFPEQANRIRQNLVAVTGDLKAGADQTEQILEKFQDTAEAVREVSEQLRGMSDLIKVTSDLAISAARDVIASYQAAGTELADAFRGMSEAAKDAFQSISSELDTIRTQFDSLVETTKREGEALAAIRAASLLAEVAPKGGAPARPATAITQTTAAAQELEKALVRIGDIGTAQIERIGSKGKEVFGKLYDFILSAVPGGPLADALFEGLYPRFVKRLKMELARQ